MDKSDLDTLLEMKKKLKARAVKTFETKDILAYIECLKLIDERDVLTHHPKIDKALETKSDREEWVAFCHMWSEIYEDQRVPVKNLVEMAMTNLLLPGLLHLPTDKPQQFNTLISLSTKLGRALQKRVDEVYGAFKIKCQKLQGYTNLYYLETTDLWEP